MKKLFNVRILGIFILCLSMAISSSAFAADKYVGKITRTKGEIRLKSDKRIQSGKWLRVKRAGVRIFNGDEIRSLAGETEITFNDGSVLKIKKNTHFKVEERLTKKSFFSFVLPNTINRNIKVFFGSLWAKVVPKKGKWTSFESKSAVAGIKGTTVSLYVDSRGDMQFSNKKGNVELAKHDGSFILKVDSGRDVLFKQEEGGKTLVESVKGDMTLYSDNVDIKLSSKDAIIFDFDTEDDKTVVDVINGSVDVRIDDYTAKLNSGDGISLDSIGDLSVTSGTVKVINPDGSTTDMQTGDTLTTGKETDKTPERYAGGTEDDDEEEEEDALEVVDDPIPVETDLPPSQSNP